MEKQDIALMKQIQEEKITWNQEIINRTFELHEKGLVEFKSYNCRGQWEVTEKGMVFV
jgi:hypothetical protein